MIWSRDDRLEVRIKLERSDGPVCVFRIPARYARIMKRCIQQCTCASCTRCIGGLPVLEQQTPGMLVPVFEVAKSPNHNLPVQTEGTGPRRALKGAQLCNLC